MARYVANADFQRDCYKRWKLAGNDDKVSTISVFHINLRVAKVWEQGWKKALFCSLKVHSSKEFATARIFHFFLDTLRAAQHGLYTSNLLPTAMGVTVCLQQWWTHQLLCYPSSLVLASLLLVLGASLCLAFYTQLRLALCAWLPHHILHIAMPFTGSYDSVTTWSLTPIPPSNSVTPLQSKLHTV